ncbi:c-type cytochrome [Rhodovibrio salinarum]|uniref:Cytochrome c domain-containing protein n=1 Tax=Rhodovibrio salinarum TaxID=1087 RepID=A0A934QEU5_9PROT|nr:c-type cytochrome [Rhodovibrio salinarum]MBK1695796.1 hypothetical protein [Rhodovibrio salinarum]
MTRALLAAGALCLMTVGVQAADGDPAVGEELAQRACAMCHKLPDGSGVAVGPAFAGIAANQAPLGAEALVEVLNQPQHAPAKAQVTLPGDAHDLVAYLNGLN